MEGLDYIIGQSERSVKLIHDWSVVKSLIKGVGLDLVHQLHGG